MVNDQDWTYCGVLMPICRQCERARMSYAADEERAECARIADYEAANHSHDGDCYGLEKRACEVVAAKIRRRGAPVRRESSPPMGGEDTEGGTSMRATGEKPDLVGRASGMAGSSSEQERHEGAGAPEPVRSPGSISDNASPSDTTTCPLHIHQEDGGPCYRCPDYTGPRDGDDASPSCTDSTAFELGFRAGWAAAFEAFSCSRPCTVEGALAAHRGVDGGVAQPDSEPRKDGAEEPGVVSSGSARRIEGERSVEQRDCSPLVAGSSPASSVDSTNAARPCGCPAGRGHEPHCIEAHELTDDAYFRRKAIDFEFREEHYVYGEPGWIRIGRFCDAERRSLWLRWLGTDTTTEGFELCAGREGGDAHVKILPGCDVYDALVRVMKTQVFAAQYREDAEAAGRCLPDAGSERRREDFSKAIEASEACTSFRGVFTCETCGLDRGAHS